MVALLALKVIIFSPSRSINKEMLKATPHISPPPRFLFYITYKEKMDMRRRISTCGSCTICFKFNRLQDGRNFRKIYKYAMKPIEVNSLPDRRSAVALKLSQVLI